MPACGGIVCDQYNPVMQKSIYLTHNSPWRWPISSTARCPLLTGHTHTHTQNNCVRLSWIRDTVLFIRGQRMSRHRQSKQLAVFHDPRKMTEAIGVGHSKGIQCAATTLLLYVQNAVCFVRLGMPRRVGLVAIDVVIVRDCSHCGQCLVSYGHCLVLSSVCVSMCFVQTVGNPERRYEPATDRIRQCRSVSQWTRSVWTVWRYSPSLQQTSETAPSARYDPYYTIGFLSVYNQSKLD